MQIGVVRSFNSSFFSFKDNKILIKLTTPVFQVVLKDKGLTCTSKKVEFRFTSDLNGVEAFVMGRKIEYDEFKRNYTDLKSTFWLSTAVESTDMEAKLDGIAKTCEGQVAFINEYENIANSFLEIQKLANQQAAKNKTIIKEYCEKNIELLNNQIRLLNQDKNMYMELQNSI